MAKAKVVESKRGSSTPQKVWQVIALIFIGVFFFLAQSSFWINHTVFNQESFAQKTSEVLQSQSSRDAIATGIVDRVFEDRPVAARLVSTQVTTFVSNLLGGELSTGLMTTVINKSYAYFTSPNREDIVIDLTAIKVPLSGLISFVENRGREVNFSAEGIPDQIVLLEENSVPDMSGYVRGFVLLGGLAWLLFFGLSAVYIFSLRTRRIARAYIALGVVTGVSLFMLAIGPFIPSAISTFMANISLRPIANDLAEAFLKPFGIQIVVTLLILLAIFLLIFYRQAIMRGWNVLLNAMRRGK